MSSTGGKSGTPSLANFLKNHPKVPNSQNTLLITGSGSKKETSFFFAPSIRLYSHYPPQDTEYHHVHELSEKYNSLLYQSTFYLTPPSILQPPTTPLHFQKTSQITTNEHSQVLNHHFPILESIKVHLNNISLKKKLLRNTKEPLKSRDGHKSLVASPSQVSSPWGQVQVKS